MPRSRRQLSLAEVLAALKLLEKNGAKPDSTLFNDLQCGTLVAEVRFPAYRDGRTTVQPIHWQQKDISYFGDPYHAHGRGRQNDEFTLSASHFADEERSKLAKTTLAVWRGDLADSDSEFLAFFKSRNWVASDGSIVENEAIFEFCFNAQQELTAADVGGEELQVWVRSPLLHDYLDDVKARLTPPKPEETRVENWEAIYKQAVRLLIGEPGALEPRKVSKFVDKLAQWAVDTYGAKNVPGRKRIRQVIDKLIDDARNSKI